MKGWKLLTVTHDEVYLLDGENVFNATPTEKTCIVKDPNYKQRHRADIYIHQGNTATYKIAIAEFSCCVYGIYLYS